MSLRKFHSTPIKGRGKGKELGFPTINLRIPPNFITKSGVYGGRIWLDDQKKLTAIHFGPIPVFDKKEMSLEIHVIDHLVKNIPDKITFSIGKFIRHIEKFKSLEELVSQIKKDIKQIRKLGDV